MGLISPGNVIADAIRAKTAKYFIEKLNLVLSISE